MKRINEFVATISRIVTGHCQSAGSDLLRETTTFRHKKTGITMKGLLRLTPNSVRFEPRSLLSKKPIIQIPLNEIQYVISSGHQLTLGVCTQSRQYTTLFWINQLPELYFPLNKPETWQQTLETKIRKQWYRCHCGASLRQYVYMNERRRTYKVCPCCWCRVQRLDYRGHQDQVVSWWWADLPVTLCPSTEVIARADDFLKLYVLHTPSKLPSIAQYVTFDVDAHHIRHILRLLKNKWKLRKKWINGRPYAYAQRKTEYTSLGPWKSEYNGFLQSKRAR